MRFLNPPGDGLLFHFHPTRLTRKEGLWLAGSLLGEASTLTHLSLARFSLYSSYTKMVYLRTVIVNFMSQLDWTTGCPHVWLNIILDMSVRLFIDVTTFELVDRVKQIGLLLCVVFIQSTKGLNRTKGRVEEYSFCLLAGTWVFSCIWSQTRIYTIKPCQLQTLRLHM